MYCIKKDEKNKIYCKIINYLNHYHNELVFGSGFYPRSKDSKSRGIKAFEEVLKIIKDKLKWDISISKLKSTPKLFKVFKDNKQCYVVEKDNFFELHKIKEKDFHKLELSLYVEEEEGDNINEDKLILIKEFIEENELNLLEKLNLIHHLSVIFPQQEQDNDV